MEFCRKCQRVTESKAVRHASGTEYLCVVCGSQVDFDIDDEWDYETHGDCPTCGGEGTAEYNDCPETWGEDCPSEVNHLITCPNCGGSGNIDDCKYF